jgi:hypothetical protein
MERRTIVQKVKDEVEVTLVSTPGDLIRALMKRHPSFNKKDWPPRTSLRNWFSFVGKGCAARLAEPTDYFQTSYELGTDAHCHATAGRKPKLAGCEAAMDDLKVQIKAARKLGVAVNTPLVRAMLVANMKVHNLEHKLSPHLLDTDAEPNPQLFMATASWIANFMADSLSMTRRAVTGDAGKLPDDWEKQREQSFLRIAGKLQINDIPRDRFFQADQTNAYIFPSPECALCS